MKKTLFLTVSKPPSFLTCFGIRGPRENAGEITSVFSNPWLPSGSKGAALWNNLWAQDVTGRGQVESTANLCCSKWWIGFSELIIRQFHREGFSMVLQRYNENTSVEGSITTMCKYKISWLLLSKILSFYTWFMAHSNSSWAWWVVWNWLFGIIVVSGQRK